MKQKKFGKKVQNWHRPLGRDELSQRYRRTRYMDPEFDDESGQPIEPEQQYDGYWDIYDPHDDWFCTRYAGELDGEYIQLKRYLQVLSTKQGFYNVSPDHLQNSIAIDQANTDVDGISQQQAQVLAMYLEHDYLTLHEKIESILVEPLDLYIVNAVAREIQNPHFAQWVFLFAPFWIRSPRTWQRGDSQSLIEHLFVRYPVPAYLYNEWFIPKVWPRKWLYWFLILAQGGNLKQFAPHWCVNAGFQQYLNEVPASMKPLGAAIYARVRQLGGQQQDSHRILSHSAYVQDVTRDISMYASDHPVQQRAQFWEQTVLWLSQHSEQMNDEQCTYLLTWAQDRYVREGTFSWQGRAFASSLARAQTHYQEIQNPYYHYHWLNHGCDWTFEAGEDTWSITEILNGTDLQEEGTAMRHCVLNYIHRCVNGESAIFSMRKNGQRCLTIELDAEIGQISQALGRTNRMAKKPEIEILGHWIKQVLSVQYSDMAVLARRLLRRRQQGG